MKKDKISKAFKTYNLVMNEVWKLLTIILIGVFIAWLIKRKNGSNVAIVLTITISLVIGLAVFFVGLINLSKKKEKEENALQETNK